MKFQQDLERLNNGDITTKEALDIWTTYSDMFDLKQDMHIRMALEFGKTQKEFKQINEIVNQLVEWKKLQIQQNKQEFIIRFLNILNEIRNLSQKTN